ncbi:MAG: hypothetical protein IPG39_15530 [Bacteroidetes bacterium]|nr:hypothetical protein [Bacteroidota bacterium]
MSRYVDWDGTQKYNCIVWMAIHGIKASIRIDLILEEGLNVKVVLFPDGDDPDSFARKHSAIYEVADYIKESAHRILSVLKHRYW